MKGDCSGNGDWGKEGGGGRGNMAQQQKARFVASRMRFPREDLKRPRMIKMQIYTKAKKQSSFLFTDSGLSQKFSSRCDSRSFVAGEEHC